MIFCFKSCLKGERDREYYEVLGIGNDTTVTTELIKKQYKKMSLNLHPDKLAQRGVEVTAEHKQQFLKVKEAYDILSDPKRRRLYDELGPSGLKLLEKPNEVNPMEILKNYKKNRNDCCSVALLLAAFFCSLLILPILFALKCDGTVGDDVKWVALWTPMWIVDAFLLFSAVMMLFDDGSVPAANEEEEGDEPTTPEKIPLSVKLVNLISTLCLVLIQIFLMIKLDNYVDWSWFIVFIPWFIREVIEIPPNIYTGFIMEIPLPDYENIEKHLEEGVNSQDDMFMHKIELESQYFEMVMQQKVAQKAVLVSFLRIWLAVFLGLRLDEIVTWNWGLVLLPIWAYLFMQYMYVCAVQTWASSKMVDIDVEAIQAGLETNPIKLTNFQQGSLLQANASFTCLSQFLPLFMALTLISRLEVSSFTTFVIILPIFIGIGCCCGVVFCSMCCLACLDVDEFEAQQKESDVEVAEGTYAPPEGETIVVEDNKTNEEIQSPVVHTTENHGEEEKGGEMAPLPAPVEATSIDVDID